MTTTLTAVKGGSLIVCHRNQGRGNCLVVMVSAQVSVLGESEPHGASTQTQCLLPRVKVWVPWPWRHWESRSRRENKGRAGAEAGAFRGAHGAARPAGRHQVLGRPSSHPSGPAPPAPPRAGATGRPDPGTQAVVGACSQCSCERGPWDARGRLELMTGEAGLPQDAAPRRPG